MLNDKNFKNFFMERLAENGFQDLNLARIVLTDNICNIMSRNLPLKERDKMHDTMFKLEVEENLTNCKTIYEISAQRANWGCIGEHISYLNIVIRNDVNPEVYTYAYCGEDNHSVYNYRFTKKGSKGMYMMYIRKKLDYGAETDADVIERFYNKETSEIIGHAYLNAHFLDDIYRYGIDGDYCSSWKEPFSLAQVYAIFHEKANKFLNEDTTSLRL